LGRSSGTGWIDHLLPGTPAPTRRRRRSVLSCAPARRSPGGDVPGRVVAGRPAGRLTTVPGGAGHVDCGVRADVRLRSSRRASPGEHTQALLAVTAVWAGRRASVRQGVALPRVWCSTLLAVAAVAVVLPPAGHCTRPRTCRAACIPARSLRVISPASLLVEPQVLADRLTAYRSGPGPWHPDLRCHRRVRRLRWSAAGLPLALTLWHSAYRCTYCS
jgi:hypothetical protein